MTSIITSSSFRGRLSRSHTLARILANFDASRSPGRARCRRSKCGAAGRCRRWVIFVVTVERRDWKRTSWSGSRAAGQRSLPRAPACRRVEHAPGATDSAAGAPRQLLKNLELRTKLVRVVVNPTKATSATHRCTALLSKATQTLFARCSRRTLALMPPTAPALTR